MAQVFCDIAVSADGFSAGPGQSLETPLGRIDERRLHGWMFEHADENRAEIDAIVRAGAFIMGRNMFSPHRGPHDPEWRGWWGPNPPYHGPVFVLTSHPRDPIPMEGGTTFHFVTEGIEAALDRARAAAGERDVSVAGGASTVNRFLAAGLLDELRLHITPSLLGAGTRIFDGLPPMDFELVSARAASTVTHVTYRFPR